MGPAITQADGVLLTRAKQLRGCDYFSLFGKFAVARTCYRTVGEPGICPLDAQVNLPERCSSYFLQEWMTVFAVEHPFKERAGCFAQLFDPEVAESVLIEVAKEAPEDYEGCYAQRPMPPEELDGELLVVSFDGKGVPMLKEAAVKLTAKLSTGEKRQKKKEALVGSATRSMPSRGRLKRSRDSWWRRKWRVRAGSEKTRGTRRPELSKSGASPAWCGRSRP